MKEAFLLLSLFALLCFSIQLPSSSSTLSDTSRVVLFHRKQAPLNWINNGFSSPKKEIRFFIALKQRNTKQLEETLYRVAHPSSPFYGQYLTYQQVLDVVAPPKAHHDLVVEWLIKGGVNQSNIISRRDSLEVLAQVKIVESLFNTTMYSFVNSKSGRVIEAHMGNISIPASVHQYIDMVSALSLFPPQRRRSQPSELQKRQTTTPWTIAPHLRKVYNIPANLRATNPKTTQAAVEFEWPGCFSYDDMMQYSDLVELPYTNVTRLIPPDQWSDEGCDAETTMDLQLMSNVGSGANSWFFTNQFWMYEFTQTLMSLDDPPLVTSLSWGWMEAQQCDQVTNAQCSQLGVDSAGYVRRTDTEFLKAATMGLSIIVCTQDEGAPSDNNNYCSLDNTKTPVWPIYPSSSPWVTAVGATTIISGSLRDEDDASQLDDLVLAPGCKTFTCNNGTAEKVAMSVDQDTLFTSGGGFSNYTARPAYQDKAVDAYIKSKGLRPPAGTWGVNNRGYPDISTAGSQTLVVLGGVPQWNGGTSASTPTFAGLVSLLNDYRLNKGKKQLGFLNFLLYEMGDTYPQAFHPITQGNNTCTGWELNTCCKYGYSAIAGWNPAVGFGTPNFANILTYISKLP